jgi:succinyl-diaminopimelate desuccinylase
MRLTTSSLVEACREVDPEPLIALTYELVSHWTPPGAEGPVAELLAEALARAGARVAVETRFQGSPTVLAELGAGGGPCLQWHGHTDAIDAPHPPAVRAGHVVRGRGAADMKGGLAAMVGAAQVLAAHGMPEQGKVLITFHGMHESGGNEPLHDLIARGVHGDAVIIGELGDAESLPISALGLTIWEIEVDGPSSSVHELNAPPGTVHALEVGHVLLAELAELRDRLAAARRSEPGASLFLGSLQAGDYFNRYPLGCRITGTRRNDDGESLEQVALELEEIVDRVRAATGAAIRLRTVPAAGSYALDAQEPIVAAARDAFRALRGREPRLTRSAAVGNAATFVHEAQVPAIYIGCDYTTAHSDAEVVDARDVARVAGDIALTTHLYLERSTGSRP